MSSYKGVEKTVANIVKKVSRNKKVLAIYLFGSYARGTAVFGSDIDLCVFGERLNKAEKSDIISYSGKAIDVVVFDDMPLEVRHSVFKYGKPVFIRNGQAVERIGHTTVREMLDWSPIRERRFQELLDKI